MLFFGDISSVFNKIVYNLGYLISRCKSYFTLSIALHLAIILTWDYLHKQPLDNYKYAFSLDSVQINFTTPHSTNQQKRPSKEPSKSQNQASKVVENSISDTQTQSEISSDVRQDSSLSIITFSKDLVSVHIPPKYPEDALMRNQEGTVILLAKVPKNGGLASQIDLIEPSKFASLNQSATQAVSKWRFNPNQNTQGEYYLIKIPIIFKIES
jgi:TonB family protein